MRIAQTLNNPRIETVDLRIQYVFWDSKRHCSQQSRIVDNFLWLIEFRL